MIVSGYVEGARMIVGCSRAGGDVPEFVMEQDLGRPFPDDELCGHLWGMACLVDVDEALRTLGDRP